MLDLKKMIEELPERHTHYNNTYSEEYWLIPAFVLKFKPKMIVELGTDQLISATMIDGTMPDDATFFTIDIEPACRGRVENTSIKAIPITGDTLAIGKKWKAPIDLLFIDARHEYGNVLNELLLYADHVTTCILLHDVIICPEVQQAVDKWLEDHSDQWDYIKFDSRCGMGILLRKGVCP